MPRKSGRMSTGTPGAASKWHMRSHREPRRRPSARLAAWPAVTVIALLLAGWPTAANARVAPRATAGICTKNAAGRLTNCPVPVRAALLPTGARDRRMIYSTPTDLATLVDTRTWTSGGGNTFPGADVPFGMVQWSPDTVPDRPDGGGYTYGDHELTGYGITHVSGPGCPAAGDVPILPMTGPLPSGNLNAVTTSFTNAGEVAQAGYYSARSNSPDTITSRFTAATHSALGQFTFPKTKAADFLIKLDDSELPDSGSTARIIGDDEIAGSVWTGHFCREQDRYGEQGYRLYFDITFNRPFSASRVVSRGGRPHWVFVTFDATKSPVVLAHVAVSYVSTANARLDWQTETPGSDFARYKASAQRTWNALLGQISVSGGSYARIQEFYSLLYKDFLEPCIISDVNGQYLGSDLKVHTLSGDQRNEYGMFSGWDIYHSLAQLQAIFDPAAASDMAQSLINEYSQSGILPRWGYLSLDNYTMTGDPADAIIADYYAFGARGFDTSAALTDMLRQADTVNHIRPGEANEAKYGYLPQDASYGCCQPHDYASALLEYDTADFALSQYAAALGDSADAAMLAARADNWAHIFNPADDLLAPKLESGAFVPGIYRRTEYRYYTEGTAAEYLWDVPNDYAGLFADLGGDAAVRPELDRYLSRPNAGGLYAFLSDEFDLGEQFAPDYDGDPAQTQAVIEDIRQNLYRPGPFGLDNNDDLGAESSQFIWESLGLYPENPGSVILVLTSPGFGDVTIHLQNGNEITIKAAGAASGRYYVRGLTINGQPDSKLYTSFATLEEGATLDWSLSSAPTSWGSAPTDAPPSYPAG
jgi:predicted alpha-1,2-mannosidase